MPSSSICVLGAEKLLRLEFLSSVSCFPGPWLFPARSSWLAGACALCRGVFQQGGASALLGCDAGDVAVRGLAG